MEKADFGIIGLGVMGSNFLLNVAQGGVSAAGFDVDGAKRDELANRVEGDNPRLASDLGGFFASLSTPRTVMMFVPENLVDGVVSQCTPHLEHGDLLIDGGNSHFSDTERRSAAVTATGARYLGVGVSGGEEGARNGACIMVGGDAVDFERVRAVFENASARIDGKPCVAHVGSGSAGHFVKMVHNGIEYGLMQVIAEAFDAMRRIGGMRSGEIAEVFGEWGAGRLDSFLVEITRDILLKIDEDTERPLVDMILDKAAQKGTGKWTSQAAMDLGVPVPTIDAAVRMRQISALKEVRTVAAASIPKPAIAPEDSARSTFISDLENSVFGSFISVYSQGMSLLSGASREKGYSLDMVAIAEAWRGGCIIRSRLLEDVASAFRRDARTETLLTDSGFLGALSEALPPWRDIVGLLVRSGVPCLGMSSALGYVEAMTAERLPADLIQAQRDYFGAHTYERTDRPGRFHTPDWKP